MNIPCPCCKAMNSAGPNCRRCKADLTLLFELEARREYCLAHAVTNHNLALAEEAHALRPDKDSLKTIALAAVVSGDFARAFSVFRNSASLT